MSGSRTNTLLAGVFLFWFAAAPSTSSGQAHSINSRQAHSTRSGQTHSTRSGQAQSQIHDRPDPATVLSQQVWALQTLHDLDLDVAQLGLLRAAVAKPEEDPAPRAVDKLTGNVPAKYLATLEALRQALLHDKDTGDANDQIDELRDELESIREDESVELDDHVQITDGARARVPEVMKSLQPSQLAGYLAAYQDEVPDPVQSLLHAADESRGMDDGKFNALAETTARDIGILLAGLDKEKAAPVAQRVHLWLEQSHLLSNADFKASQAELEKAAKAVIGEVDSFDVLRHWIERDVAELLSNPQLGPMIDERIKHADK